MADPVTPRPRGRVDVTVEQYHAILSVANLAEAIDFYSNRLGFLHAFSWGDPPTMAGVNLGGTQIFLQAGTPSPAAVALYYVVEDADVLYEFHRANGVKIVQEPGDREWDFRDYTVVDQDGYRLTFGQRL